MTAAEVYNRGQVESSEDDSIRVDLPGEPPRLTPQAARVLLRILLKALDRLEGTDPPKELPQ
jgi:hypothetical protein